MIVFDLDGCLRNNDGCEHTVPDDMSRAEHWLEWQRWVNENGKPIKPIVGLFESFSLACNDYDENWHDLVILTNSQFGTRRWLNSVEVSVSSDLTIIEREHDDHRHPHDFKRDFIDSNRDDIELWVDDDPVILDYVEKLGIPVIRVGPRIRGRKKPMIKPKPIKVPTVQIEVCTLRDALIWFRGNQTKAAEYFGINRGTLRQRTVRDYVGTGDTVKVIRDEHGIISSMELL
jgi:hypothetical protein